ncbi:MAG TPA: Slp family lipoprotein [Dokdonella sp.]|jgi:outer membrane lipoprotein|nr:Slp family lipoprotein [Dokdonella sp.]
MHASNPLSRLLLAMLLPAALASCATPVFRDTANSIAATPADVQQQPESFHGAEVVWGGRIVAVENRADTTEVEIVAYPLDRDQQPSPEEPTQGRFILVLPGFVEPFDYPAGRHLTVQGILSGTRVGRVQEHEYVYPLVRAKAVHVWPWGFIFDKKPRVTIGVGARIR